LIVENYECPQCFLVRPWTDGQSKATGDETDEYWCQMCGAESPLSACRRVPAQAGESAEERAVQAAFFVMAARNCLVSVAHARDYTDDQVRDGELLRADEQSNVENMEFVAAVLNAAARAEKRCPRCDHTADHHLDRTPGGVFAAGCYWNIQTADDAPRCPCELSATLVTRAWEAVT
jgi:hypothetical protein